jgi:folate-binding protein YgfZ
MTRYDHTILRFGGPDAAEFLQGQLSQDVREIAETSGLLAAWCTGKGRVIALGRALAMHDAIGIALPSSLAANVMQKIVMYRLRAKFTVEIATDWACIAVHGITAMQALKQIGLMPAGRFQSTQQYRGITAVLIAEAGPVIELYGPQEAIQDLDIDTDSMLSASNWNDICVESGIPTVTAECSELFTPHMLNLDLLGAISFSKGCYPGQEIVARTQYLGESKRRLQRFRLAAETNYEIGNEVLLGSDFRGITVNLAGNDALVVAPVERNPDPGLAKRMPMAYSLP